MSDDLKRLKEACKEAKENVASAQSALDEARSAFEAAWLKANYPVGSVFVFPSGQEGYRIHYVEKLGDAYDARGRARRLLRSGAWSKPRPINVSWLMEYAIPYDESMGPIPPTSGLHNWEVE